MQYKKEEVRQRILEVGSLEFYEHGFQGASLRKILKKAGTTIGNFYNYFDNKEALFDELVKEDYIKFIKFIKEHDEVERPDYLWEKSNPSMWKEVLGSLLRNLMPEFGMGFVLMVSCSKGTKYESTKQELTTMMEEHFIEHVDKLGCNHVSSHIGGVIASQIVDGLLLVIGGDYDTDTKHELMVELLLFYMIGTMGLLGDC